LDDRFDKPAWDGENAFQRRSRLGGILNVPLGYVSGSFSPRALLEAILTILQRETTLLLYQYWFSVPSKGYASGFDSPAALPGTRRVSARRGWAGEES
jgi:hypothetical protein